MHPRRLIPLRSVRYTVLACLGLGAVSLLGPHQPTYDPWAWLLWGREILHGDLDTLGGPSWKPLPVLFTAPFSLAGAAAPELWIVVARAGLLLALVAGYRLARSIAGPAAGLLAAAGILLIDRFSSFALRGNSEGLLVALSLGALDRHRAGRRGQALAAGFGAALIRPEIWPFLGAYALWLAGRRAGVRRRRALASATAGAAVLLAAWFVPEKIGSGRFSRGADRAREAVEGSPAQADHPFLAVFGNSAGAVAIPLYVGAVVAVALAALAWRRRRSGAAPRSGDWATVLALAGAGTAYMIIVGVLAEAGFTGNERYVMLPAATVCVLGGAGIALIVREAARRRWPRWVPALLAVAGAAGVVEPVRDVRHQLSGVRREARLADHLEAAIARAGGAERVRACGKVFTDPFQTQILLWHLHETGRALGIHPRPPGTIVAPASTDAALDERFALLVEEGGWVVRSTCR